MTQTTTPYESGAVSEVAICNKALRYLGAAEILSFAQNSREADLCLQGYTEARNELLAAHHWSFATRYTTLAPLGDDPLDAEKAPANAARFGYSCAYRLPMDCLAVQRLWDNEPYLLTENSVVYTDASPAKAVLTVMVDNPKVFPPLFVEALARRLAASLAVALVNNARLEQTMFQRFTVAFEAARLADAAQETPLHPTPDTEDPWIAAR